MNCENTTTYIDVTDFACVGQVAQHCDLQKLCIAINEAQDFDLDGLFCAFWPDILDIWNEVTVYKSAVAACDGDAVCIAGIAVPTNYLNKVNLICGGNFTGCNDKLKNHPGVAKILVYYAYSRYLVLNGFNDTPNGSVQKTNSFSLPTPLKEVQAFADKYRIMGYESFKKTLNYLCKNRDVFEFESDQCAGCGCDGSCKSGTAAKGFGIRTSVITK